MPDKNHSIGSKQTDNQTPLTQYSRFCPCDFFFVPLGVYNLLNIGRFQLKTKSKITTYQHQINEKNGAFE